MILFESDGWRMRKRERHIICLYATYIYKQKHADIHTHATLDISRLRTARFDYCTVMSR